MIMKVKIALTLSWNIMRIAIQVVAEWRKHEHSVVSTLTEVSSTDKHNKNI
jgi:hypothetical protein